MSHMPPIFIHSLFRSGSTYLFMVFRRSGAGYWCYQEPLHEIAFFSRDNTSGLEQDHGENKAQLLRHPAVDSAYFRELKETWPAWKDVITEPIIYDAYFLGENEEIGIRYWEVLAEAARGRPVFQECRTSGRIGAIKSRMGGYHIYLWRNPWDQWWSYKVAPYFDVANQIILHASQAPKPVQLLLEKLDVPAYEGKDLAGAFAFYGERPLTSEQSYLAFYLLWCLGLREGTYHADILLNIDRLSDSTEYREKVVAQLKDAGIDGIDFSDCHVPQGVYLERERDFFATLEKWVHHCLLQGGWTQEEIDHIQTLRHDFAPKSWNAPVMTLSPAELAEQASRARMLVCRFETNSAKAEARVKQAELHANEAETRADEAKQRAAEAEARAETLRVEIEALRNSLSWRITAPLRFGGSVMISIGLFLRRGLNESIRRAIDTFQYPLSLVMRFVLRHPSLSTRLNTFLLKYPALYGQLLSVAQRRGIISYYAFPNQRYLVHKNGSLDAELSRLSQHTPIELAHLSPRAWRIYSDLKSAILRGQQEGR